MVTIDKRSTSSPKITCLVNGESHQFKSEFLRMTDIIDHLSIPKEGLIVEHNGQLYKEGFDRLQVIENDCIECIHFMGGGAIT